MISIGFDNFQVLDKQLHALTSAVRGNLSLAVSLAAVLYRALRQSKPTIRKESEALNVSALGDIPLRFQLDPEERAALFHTCSY